MDENFLNVLYIEHTDKIGVLKDDKDERVSIILGTDKTLVERKREGKMYLLVPLAKYHTFVCKGNSIDVDGTRRYVLPSLLRSTSVLSVPRIIDTLSSLSSFKTPILSVCSI
jgi:hypothetical protein